MPTGFSIRATVMQTPAPDRLEVLTDAIIDVDDSGTITAIGSHRDHDGDNPRTVDHELGPDVVLLPGFVDTHIHAPQWPQLGTGLDLPLDQWLFAYTFPLEARFVDLAFASTVWEDMVATLLAHGTTTAVYYGTVDLHSTTLLAQTCADLGQRAFVGRVAMDHPEGTPEWYRDADAVAAVAASRASIEQIRAIGSNLVQPIVTPRFIPACTDEALRGLGSLAAETGALVQTHCSENDWEHGYVIDRCLTTDTEALDRFGLLRANTVLAHAGHVTPGDLVRMGGAGAGVAHCPLSNAYFGDAVFPARRALDAGLNVGLGTDIAGGASPSVLSQCSQAVTVARQLEHGVDAAKAGAERGVANSRIDIVTAFWMATVGGAQLLDQPVGLLAPGHAFDAVAIRVNRPGSGLRAWPEVDDDSRLFEKIVRLAGSGDIERVWVQGTNVSGS